MKRRTLDIVFSAGGLLVAILVLVLGLVLQNQANFAKDYVHDQMAQQRITFTPAEGLSDEEKAADCLVENAGQPLLTGKQAECYANEYIGLHLAETNEGKTYSETSGESRGVAAELEAAMEDDPESPETLALQAQSEERNAKVQTLFRGEALRGLIDFSRIEAMLARIQGRIDLKRLARVTPLAAPLFLEPGRIPVHGEARDRLASAQAQALMEAAGLA